MENGQGISRGGPDSDIDGVFKIGIFILRIGFKKVLLCIFKFILVLKENFISFDDSSVRFFIQLYLNTSIWSLMYNK